MQVDQLSQLLADVVEQQVAPFVCASVANGEGVLWEGGSGFANDEHLPARQAVMQLSSATKAIGGLMAVMAIDRGLLAMDTPVGDILPQYDSLQVLVAMDGSNPVFRKPKRRPTLRHLLSHRQGQGYGVFYPLMADYMNATGAPNDRAGLVESLNLPFLFDPGDGFAYGIGSDAAGLMVATAAGKAVDAFARDEILVPLGMGNSYFEAADAGGLLAKVWGTNRSNGVYEPFGNALPVRPEFYHMGNALYSTAADYTRFLRFVLNRGELDGVRLVGREAMELMFADQMEGVPMPRPILASSAQSNAFDVDLMPRVRKTHTAAFVKNLEPVVGMRAAGSLWWAGGFNTHYWVDPASDLAAVFFTQMAPFCYPPFMLFLERFERAVYAKFGPR